MQAERTGPDLLWESPNRKMLLHWNSRKTEWGEINQRGGLWNSMAQKLRGEGGPQLNNTEPMKEKRWNVQQQENRSVSAKQQPETSGNHPKNVLFWFFIRQGDLWQSSQEHTLMGNKYDMFPFFVLNTWVMTASCCRESLVSLIRGQNVETWWNRIQQKFCNPTIFGGHSRYCSQHKSTGQKGLFSLRNSSIFKGQQFFF